MTRRTQLEAGITLEPIAPVQLTAMNGEPRLQITVQGSTDGGATVAGGFALIRRSSRTELRFTRITGYVESFRSFAGVEERE